MYAVIRTGGKQYRVEHGAQLEVERLDATEGSEVTLKPLLVVDGSESFATPSQLADAAVKAKVVGSAKGPKINGFTYKSKSNNRRRWGHRQGYTVIEITSITAAGKESTPPSPEEKPADTPMRKAATGEAQPAKAAKTPDGPAKRKPAAKRAAGEKSAVKKAAATKGTAKKSTAKKATAKKATTKATKKTTRTKDGS